MDNNGSKSIADGSVGPKGSRAAGSVPLYQRAVVHDVIFDPVSLTDEEIESMRSRVRFTNNIRNLPRNSVIAERIRTGATEVNGPEIFYPFFSPHLCLPVSPGEQVWVMFEDPSMVDAQGFWIDRVAEMRSVDDINHTHADRKFDRRAAKKTADKGLGTPPPVPGFQNGAVGLLDGEDVTLKGTGSIPGGPDAYKNIISSAKATRAGEMEDVPRFTKRPGDLALQGANNTLVVLGTDRSSLATNPDGSLPAADVTAKSGTITASVGRGRKPTTSGKKIKNARSKDEIDKTVGTQESRSEGDFDFDNDAATIVLSMSTKADRNFAVKHGKLKDTSSAQASAAVVKADQVRIIAREDIKLLVKATAETPDSEAAMIVIKKSGDIVFIPSEKGVIKLGGDDADMALLGTHAGVVNTSGRVSASPIIDSMGGAQGGSDGLNGKFATRVLVK